MRPFFLTDRAMQQTTNIFLIGPMGVGKSTIGRQLAEMLRLDFADSDHVIQERTGVDIPTIFDFEGEEGFRRREKAVIDELSRRSGLVLATGGGVVLDPDNRRVLAATGLVVYLYCSPEQQCRRTERGRSRPLLQTEDPLAMLQELQRQRDPLYRQIADLRVSTENRSAVTVAKDIVNRIEKL